MKWGVKLINALEDVGQLTYTPLEGGDDWENAWKSHFSLLEVGKRIVIKPSWVEHTPEPGQVVIEIGPGHGLRHRVPSDDLWLP